MRTERSVFYEPGVLRHEELELVLAETLEGDAELRWAPAYRFRMVRTGDYVDMGRIDLRIGNFSNLRLYAGHIGYGVQPEFRGHHYAARSVRLLMPLARQHDFSELWITCNPDNYASRRTCELAGAVFVEIVDLPPDSDMYLRGERQKCRYRLDL